MPQPKVYEFSKHIGPLCVTRDTDVYKLGARLGVDPLELPDDRRQRDADQNIRLRTCGLPGGSWQRRSEGVEPDANGVVSLYERPTEPRKEVQFAIFFADMGRGENSLVCRRQRAESQS